MCITDKNTCLFYSFDYSLTLHLNKSGGVSGFLETLSNSIRYPIRGFYLCRNSFVEFTFSVEWSFPDEKNYGCTCFSGHFVNDQILLIDWMLIDDRSSDKIGITGSDFLYSSSLALEKERMKMPINIRPFPINARLLRCASTLI